MLFNLTCFERDEELCEQFEIPEKICLNLCLGTIVGALKKNLQTELNLRSDLPVVAVGGDQQAAAVGLGGCAWFAVCEYRHRVVYFSTCRTSGF